MIYLVRARENRAHIQLDLVSNFNGRIADIPQHSNHILDQNVHPYGFFLFAHVRYAEAINDRLETVTEWQSEIFAMRHLENMSIQEISDRTQRSSDAVRSSLYRVKRLLFETADLSPTVGAGASARSGGR